MYMKNQLSQHHFLIAQSFYYTHENTENTEKQLTAKLNRLEAFHSQLHVLTQNRENQA